MPSSFVEQLGNSEASTGHGYSIAPATVLDNMNLLLDGRVQVKISSVPAVQPWARMVSVGAGSSRGFMWLPQVNDEVLVAYNQNDPRDCFVLGGMWNLTDLPPSVIPTDFMTKRILKTGLAGDLGHTVEFDDALQSIKITSSTKQQISIDPTTITISTPGSAMSIALDLAAAPPGITIQAKAGNISLSAPAGKISIKGLAVEVISTTTLDLKSTGPCTIAGLPVKIN